MWTLALSRVSINKSAVDFESVFDIEKTFEKMTALFKNRTMVEASSFGPNKHKRRRLRYRGEDACAILENAYPIMKRSDDCGKLS